MNEINLGETDAKILNININRAITELRTTNMTPFSFSESYLSDANHQYLDGCQFPKYNYADKNPDTTYDNPSYPPGKEYLKIWDMLDCKIARALGFGPEVSVPNLVIMILAGILTGGLGIIFFIATFVFAFYLIALTVRALHIFIMSSIAISILIYISPLTISACLFEKTKDIFNGWKENLISFVFQPIILFVYLGLVIVIFEKVVIGDAQFIGSGRDSPKSISCSVGNAANNSIYCIFGFNLMRNIEGDGLDFLGIYLGSLFGMTEEKMFTIIKAAFLMYILTKFLDQIPDFAQRLLGGMALSSSSVGAGRALYKSYGASRAVQSRGSRGTRKWVPKIIGKVGRSNSSSLQNNLTGKTSKKTGPEDRPPPKPTTGAG
ncbi:MAG: type IV secretory pathway VirB6-like protein [Rickettsiales bacterium]|jgi:type IV secretory pathway VirB6-like protein